MCYFFKTEKHILNNLAFFFFWVGTGGDLKYADGWILLPCEENTGFRGSLIEFMLGLSLFLLQNIQKS